MKKVLFTTLFAVTSFIALAQQEWVSASIGNGAGPHKVDLFIQTTTTFYANQCNNLVFTIRVPIAAGNNVVLTETYHSPDFSHITFPITKYAVNDGTYYYYLINGTGTISGPPSGPQVLVGSSVRVLEITLTGGTNGIVELANIENDLPGNNGALIRPQFYAQLNVGDVTNNTAMFYGTNGAVAHNNTLPNGDDWVPTASLVNLPVHFIDYNVQCSDKGVLLVWSTAFEQNSDKFEIQRSYNGTDWATVDNVAAAGYSSTQRNYQYLDLNGGTAFYRIRQVDKDGRFIYTAIQHTNCKTGQYDITLYPLPAKDNLTVAIKSDKAVKTDLQILDMNGRTIRSTITKINKGNNNIILNVSDLPGGQYMLTSSDPSIIINKKFTVLR